MRKPLFGFIIILVFLTSYNPNFESDKASILNIKKIVIENNSLIQSEKIIKKLEYLYNSNLFFLNKKLIQTKLKEETFVENVIIKKIYPKTIKIIVIEITPIAVLQDKKKRYYVTNKGDLKNFIIVKKYKDLPTVFGNGRDFYTLYQNLQNIQFPINLIKSYYLFESGRWDLILKENKTIKLPIDDYLSSLKNFMDSKNINNFESYKIFDYRIKDQLILN